MSREGYKMTEVGEIPEDWDVKLLEKICKIEIGGTPARNNPSYWATNNSNGHKWVSISDLKGKFVSNTSEHITDEGVNHSNVKLVPSDSVIMSFKLSIGKISITTVDLYTNEAIAAFYPKKSLHKYYMYHILPEVAINSDYETAIKGATLSKSKLERLKIPLPPLPEQQKIASILSTLDATIENTESLIDKYRDIKKGLMADLLTRGIDENGRIRSEETHRFKDSPLGRVPEEWDVKTIIDVCDKPQYGYTQSATDRPIGPNFLRITDIQNGNVNWDEVPYCYCPKDEIDKYLLESGDVLFARTGATTGKSYQIKECPKTVFASYLIRVKSKKNIDSKFLFMFFNSSHYWKQINEKIIGSAQGGLNATTLSRIKLPFPKITEQQKIASILSSTDERIEKEESYRDKLLQLKKAMMQDLLTGQVRVKV